MSITSRFILGTFLSFQLVTLVLCNELTLLAKNLESGFAELYHTESLLCSQLALDEFIDECSVKGADNVSPKLRLQSAVKLSICEFQDAGVWYPRTCHDMEKDEDFQICVNHFRESSQLWTTYSGHYRKLRTVCYEEAVPFIRKNILDLFFNVTKIYTDFHRSSMKTTNAAQDLQDELLSKFQIIIDLLDQSVAISEKQRETQEKTFDGFQQSMVAKSKYVEDIWEHVSSEISLNSDLVDKDLSKAQKKMEIIFEYIDKQFSRIQTASESLTASHHQVSQGIVHDLVKISKSSKSGNLVLQEILEGNLEKGLLINNLLHDTHIQMGSLFEEMELESRQIIANVTRELRDEALSIFIVFQNTFEGAFSQLMLLGQKIGETIFNMDAVSLSLDSNLVTLQDRIEDLKSINVATLFTPVISAAKVALGILIGLFILQSISRTRHEQCAFFGAVFMGAITAYAGKSLLFNF